MRSSGCRKRCSRQTTETSPYRSYPMAGMDLAIACFPRTGLRGSLSRCGLVSLVALSLLSCAQLEQPHFAGKADALAVAGPEIERLITRDFIAYDPNYLQHKAVYGGRLHALAHELATIQATGNEIACSNQIYLESKWIYHYTADWPRLDRLLSRLAASLRVPDQNFALRQSPKDGLWGVCYDEWFLKVGATFEELEELYEDGRAPKYPIRGLNRINSPLKLRTYLQSLLISDIATSGRNNRDELGAMAALLAAEYFKAYLQEFLKEWVPGIPRNQGIYHASDFAAVYEDFLMGWQNPETGYWGAQYRSNGRVYVSADLSITYHTIAYRRGQVDHWPEIIKTTLRIKNEPYPFGWMEHGHLNNHNNYDVARILRYGWPYMTPEERRRSAEEIRAMLLWTLNDSLMPDGSFKIDLTFFDSLAADYYFGVSFLDEVGFWDPQKRFWGEASFLDAPALCCLIKSRLCQLQLDQSEADDALEKLKRSCGTCDDSARTRINFDGGKPPRFRDPIHGQSCQLMVP
jgi:hypothetical protein